MSRICRNLMTGNVAFYSGSRTYRREYFGMPIVQIDRPTKRLLPGWLVNLYEWSLPVFVPKKSFISGIFPGFKQSGTKDLLLFGNISGPSTVWTNERRHSCRKGLKAPKQNELCQTLCGTIMTTTASTGAVFSN